MGTWTLTTGGGRTLMVTGDDFGLTPGVNAGVLAAHTRGVLTHASLMTAGGAADDAIAMARATPTLGVGVHLTLVDGRTVLPPDAVPSLVGADGALRSSPSGFVRDWMLDRIDTADVERELVAQIAVLVGAGLTPTHLDSHKHVHMWPPLFDMVSRLAVRFGIPVVRVAVERPPARVMAEAWTGDGARAQAIANLLMVPFGRHAERALARHALTPSRLVGRVYTGLLTAPRLEQIVSRLPEGRAELMVHPGFPDRPLEQLRTRLRAERAADVALLCAPSTFALLRRHGVDITSPEDRRPC